MSHIQNLSDIDSLLKKNEAYRDRSLNLIASENLVSPVVRDYLATELVARYGCYTTGDLADREYTGNRYIYEIEKDTQELACSIFDAKYVDLRPLGGHMAGISSVIAVTPPGGTVIEYHLKDWGHGMVGPSCEGIPHYDKTLNVEYMDFDKNKHIDLKDLEKKIVAVKPACVVIGSSGMLFPEPVEEIKAICEKYGVYLIADVSHVSGLIAGGVYPNPLVLGADIMFCSTHKSFPGPQGGMVFSNDEGLIEKVGNILSPGMVTSHHIYRLPALAAALLEIKKFGCDYGKQVIANSQALASEFCKLGFSPLAEDEGFTKTHLFLANISKFGDSREVALRLEKAGIFVSDDFGQAGNEIRIGTPEVTRRGMVEKDMVEIAQFFKRVLIDGEKVDSVAKDVALFVAPFNKCVFAL